MKLQSHTGLIQGRPFAGPRPPPGRAHGFRFPAAATIALGLLLVTGCDAPEDLAVGTLEWDRVELVAEVSEPIVAITARAGERLADGDLILQLDPRRAEARLAEAQAAQAVARARLAELRRGPREERIAEAQARLRGAVEALGIRERELTRLDQLLGRQLASAEAVDTARRLVEAARSEHDRAQAALAELTAGTTREELDQAQATLAQAEASTRILALNLARLAVRAPVPGRLDDLPFELGEQPPAGGVVAVLLAGDRPYARVYVPEAQRAHVVPGTAAEVRVDGLAEPLVGRVRKVDSDPAFTPFFALTQHDRGRLAYLAEIDLPDAPVDLPAGPPLEARFMTEGTSTPMPVVER
ncbi:HlyD family secretion protein [Thiocystis violacea]|uniref:HlyD family secretion protein n=1 Tax=Thiocystis violacea TaxID=13725 RepID=UPI0019059F62|nr:HlyD family efflux transporter periplasmic adaptor subunit [Thiocystis violacea]